MEDKWVKKHIGIFAENLSRTVDRHMLVSLWASIRDADKIGRSFLQARAAMRYRFIISNPVIISVADIDAHIEKTVHTRMWSSHGWNRA